jgi:hypothetical protein
MQRKHWLIVAVVMALISAVGVPAQAQRQHVVVFLQLSSPDLNWPDRLSAASVGNSPVLIARGRPIYQMAASPLSTYVAYVDSNPVRDGVWNTDLRLKIVSLAMLSTVLDMPLTGAQTTPDAAWEPGSAVWEPIRAIIDVSSLAWSPDGTQLAFMGAQDGPSSDLYVYSLRSDDVIRLTDGPTQGIRPVWSPDSRWIVHVAVDSLGTGAGYSVAKVFAAAADDSGVRTLYTPSNFSGDEVVHGWLNDSTVVISTWRPDCGNQELRSVDINTGETLLLWQSCFLSVAVDQADETLLVSVGDFAGASDQQDKPGVYLFKVSAEPMKIADNPGEVVYLPATGAFYHLASNGEFQAFSPSGDMLKQEAATIRILKANSEGTQFYWIAYDGSLHTAPASGGAPDFNRAAQIATGVYGFGVVN